MTTKQVITAEEKTYLVTGTFHGVIVIAKSEGQARKMFHKAYNGETITHIKNATDSGMNIYSL